MFKLVMELWAVKSTYLSIAQVGNTIAIHPDFRSQNKRVLCGTALESGHVASPKTSCYSGTLFS